MNNEPFFIIGTERSGTNLLRLILNSHPDICIPHPPHIMKNFFGLEPLYGDLSRDEAFRKLIRDVALMVGLHPYPWDIRVDEEQVFRNARGRDLISIFFAVYGQYLNYSEKKRWGCKSTFMIYHAALIRYYYPKAQFIYMVRDGRDVAASAKKTIFNHYSAYYCAQLWKKEQQIGIHLLGKLPAESVFLLKYEQLLAGPEETLKSLCAFLGHDYRPEMLDFFSTQEARKSGSLSAAWKNTSKPLLRLNSGKFQKDLTKKEIDLFEAVAFRELDYFSYTLSRPLHTLEGAALRETGFKAGYFWEEKMSMLRVQFAHLFTDRNIGLRFRKFWFLRLLKLLRKLL